MSNILVRGPVCGVNNCRSRLWRTINGQKVCQYGHIREGDLEIDEEDGEVFTQTRRLNISTLTQSQAHSIHEISQQKKLETEKLYGTAGRNLFLRCYQHVLRAQVRWLIANKGLPRVAEKIVKELWTVYLESIYTDEEMENSSHLQGGNNDDLASDEIETDTTIFTDGEAGIAAAAAAATGGLNETDQDQDQDQDQVHSETPRAKKRKIGRRRHRSLLKHNKFKSPLIHAVAMCYIACRIVKFPLYTNDFVRLCSVNKLPYMKAIASVPKKLLRQMPNIYLTVLEPSRPPVYAELYDGLRFVLDKLGDFTGDNNANIAGFHLNEKVMSGLSINPDILLMKIVKELLLPKEVYFAVKQFAAANNITFSLECAVRESRNTYSKLYSRILEFPEIKLVSIIITISKFYFIAPNIFCSLQENATTSKQARIFNWEVWLKLIYEKKLFFQNQVNNNSNNSDGDSFENFLNYVTLNNNKRETMDLLSLAFKNDLEFTKPPDRISLQLDNYLKWFNATIVSKNEKSYSELTIAEKKLLDIFNFDGAEHEEEEEKEEIREKVPAAAAPAEAVSHGGAERTDDSQEENNYEHEDSNVSQNSSSTSTSTNNAAETPPASDSDSSNIYLRAQDVEFVTAETLLKIEKVLLNELSINFGVNAAHLRLCVNQFSDKLLYQLTR